MGLYWRMPRVGEGLWWAPESNGVDACHDLLINVHKKVCEIRSTSKVA